MAAASAGPALVKLRDHPAWTQRAAAWFAEKWDVPRAEYEASIRACQAGEGPVPQWYLLVQEEAIAAGCGVIQNDFHRREDLAPNLCALYVEEPFRRRGLARQLLADVCADLAGQGVDTLYLVTEHTSFYERCGWQFWCMAEETQGGFIRLYRHVQGKT